MDRNRWGYLYHRLRQISAFFLACPAEKFPGLAIRLLRFRDPISELPEGFDTPSRQSGPAKCPGQT
jgi:hypothetical protein